MVSKPKIHCKKNPGLELIYIMHILYRFHKIHIYSYIPSLTLRVKSVPTG